MVQSSRRSVMKAMLAFPIQGKQNQRLAGNLFLAITLPLLAGVGCGCSTDNRLQPAKRSVGEERSW